MGYCTLTDVQMVLPTRSYTATSKPTLMQVEAMIELIYAEVNLVLEARGLGTPVTEPASLLVFCKYVNALGAAARAEMSGHPAAARESTPGTGLLKQYQGLLDDLRSRPLGSLPIVPFSYASENIGTWPDAAIDKEKQF